MSENPYDRPSDPAKRNSAVMTNGPERAAARSMLKAIGFTDDDIAKPFIGVATTWIETMPCNFNQRALAQKVKQGIREAGGTPLEFNTIPAAAMALARMDIPGLVFYNGTIAPGTYEDHDVTILDVF